MRTKETDFVEFSIRVPREIYEKIEEDALKAKPKRSKNSQVNFILEQHYEPQTKVAESIAVPV